MINLYSPLQDLPSDLFQSTHFASISNKRKRAIREQSVVNDIYYKKDEFIMYSDALLGGNSRPLSVRANPCVSTPGQQGAQAGVEKKTTYSKTLW